jgi:hypothetical protein
MIHLHQPPEFSVGSLVGLPLYTPPIDHSTWTCPGLLFCVVTKYPRRQAVGTNLGPEERTHHSVLLTPYSECQFYMH